MQIDSLFIYPVKSLSGIALPQAQVMRRGVAGDRRWMIVDEGSRFVTRRELPALAAIRMQAEADGRYRLIGTSGEALLEPEISSSLKAEVQVWRDIVDAIVVENDASRLISDIAGRSLRLAYMPESTQRLIDPSFASPQDRVSFADGYPILVTTQASLAALNAALDRPVPMERFRPNVVLSGDVSAWAERGWQAVHTAPLSLRLAKPCSRCIVITQDHHSGERHEGNMLPSALRTLGQSNKEGALFGMNAIPDREGVICVGDAVSAALL